MNKRKTVFTAVVMVTGIMAVIDRIRLHNKAAELEEKTQDIGRCHNDFCLMQQRYNKNTDEQLAIIQDEIGSVYEHFEEFSKGKEDGR
ncbi:conjugal transfer protein [Clostridioides difficile]|uniref:conjugal transfer protein n=1 Tax=Clostridioides difficile TaxID=1496 RepID=UPI000D1D8F01|nr:conjugal transfer protein [Clostridioides difficile]PTL50119.1 conjugal transfer protein [Clostridioides difficile]PTL53703.1 conjugal transfer protein [Clostridioides difficile]